MQQQQKPISIDVSETENYKKIVPQRPILTSHEAGWQNIILEHHRQPPHEMPEMNFQQHILIVNLKTTLSEFRMDDRFEAKNARTGDLLLIPADVDYWNADRTDTEFIALAIEPQQLLVSNDELIKSDAVELIPTLAEPDPFVYGTALALKQELEIDYYGCHLYAESLFNSLAVHLLRKYATKKPQIKNYVDGLPPYKLKQAIEYINDNLDQKIKLDDVARLLDISQFYFSHMFKESTGIPPYKYVIKQRLERAKQLIKQSKLPLAEIAYECGFTSQSQMTQHFRKCVGVTPKVYRNR